MVASPSTLRLVVRPGEEATASRRGQHHRFATVGVDPDDGLGHVVARARPPAAIGSGLRLVLESSPSRLRRRMGADHRTLLRLHPAIRQGPDFVDYGPL